MRVTLIIIYSILKIKIKINDKTLNMIIIDWINGKFISNRLSLVSIVFGYDTSARYLSLLPLTTRRGDKHIRGELHRTINNYILSWFTETYEYSNACTTWYNYTVCRTKTLPSLGLYLPVAVKPSSLNRLRAKRQTSENRFWKQKQNTFPILWYFGFIFLI